MKNYNTKQAIATFEKTILPLVLLSLLEVALSPDTIAECVCIDICTISS